MIMNDFRHALRLLHQSPGFAVTVVLSLAQGLGATTAIFSAVNGVLLKPLPYAASHRLYSVRLWFKEFAHIAPSVPVKNYLKSVASRVAKPPELKSGLRPLYTKGCSSATHSLKEGDFIWV